MSITDTLEERGKRYGDFDKHAIISQTLKHIMRDIGEWERMHPYQQEALEMIAHKIARILNGDPNYTDSWHDIAGYATLVEQRLSIMPQPAASFMDIRATDPESAKGMALEMTQSAIENGSRFRGADVTEICK